MTVPPEEQGISPGLKARHVGALVPSRFVATPYSVHERVVNFALPENLLVSLVTELREMTAFAIHVPDLDPHMISGNYKLERRGNSEILLTKAREKHSVYLEGATLFRGQPLGGRLSTELGDSLRRAVLAVAGDDGFGSLLGEPRNVFANRAKSLLGRPQRSRLSGRKEVGTDWRNVTGELERLVGLGIGFTPSGDDFIVGYLLAAEVGGNSSLRGQLLSRIEGRRGTTTPGGTTLLHLALNGSYPCYLLRFWWHLRGIGEVAHSGTTARELRVREAVRDATAHGASSGVDAVAGFTWFVLTRAE